MTRKSRRVRFPDSPHCYFFQVIKSQLSIWYKNTLFSAAAFSKPKINRSREPLTNTESTVLSGKYDGFERGIFSRRLLWEKAFFPRSLLLLHHRISSATERASIPRGGEGGGEILRLFLAQKTLRQNRGRGSHGECIIRFQTFKGRASSFSEQMRCFAVLLRRGELVNIITKSFGDR